MIQNAHPDLVLLHAMWGVNTDLQNLQKTIAQLRTAGIRRIVLLGPVPIWKRTLPHTLINSYRLRHSIPDRIATGVSGPADDDTLRAFSEVEGIGYVSAYRVLCNAKGCLTRAGPAASDVLVSDGIHLTDRGSNFLIEAIGNQLLLP